ncbi:phosphoglycerate mutase (2,3-diphosphoglycerate-independent), partial [Pseudomonas fluorescens]
IIAAIQTIAAAGVPVVLHAVTDGRDVAPKSAFTYFEELTSALPEIAKVGTVTGRYYAMDRDNRWERVGEAYAAIIHAKGGKSATAHAAVDAAYQREESDEFISATVIGDYAGAKDGDGFFCLNFRADRAREILRAIGEPAFDSFDAGKRPEWAALLG